MVLNCVQDGFTPFKDVFRYLGTVSGGQLPASKFETWSKVLEEAAMGANSDASVTALFSFISGLEDTQSYLKNVPKLDCSVFDATLEKIGSPLKRDGLVSQSYYETYFRSILPKDTVEVKSGDAVPFDPNGSEPAAGPLAGQVAVVTGASSGIGRGIVSALVAAGCHVAMGARRVEELERTKEIVMQECPGTASKALIVKTDVTQLSEVQTLVEKAEQSLGPVDILVNCAGVMYFTLMKNVQMEEWERTVDVNCKGTMYGIGAILPSMLSRGKGHIVNITSDAGRKAFAGLGIYSGSKFFVEAVSQSLRAETASSGLRVTCIQPGNVETPLLATSTDTDALKEFGEPTGAKVLEPADIGRAVVYAVSQPEWCAVNEILVEPREEPA
jgi:NADP-dependent 3-hydroxy acid dehydrogenase YdfG